MSLLSLKNVTVGYPLPRVWSDWNPFAPNRRSAIVKDCSFEMQSGEILGFIGESGCGKTTLMRAVLGRIPLTSGQIFWQGQPIEALSRKERARQIQFIFQNPIAAMNPKMTVLQILSEPLQLLHDERLTSQQMQVRAEEILSRVGLPKRFLKAYPTHLSGGEGQRVALARALINHPKLLICDEPVSALDVSIQAKILNLLMDLNEQMHLSILFISHNLLVVRQLAHRVLVMYAGTEMESGPMEKLLLHPRHPYTSALWAAVPVKGQKGGIDSEKFLAKDALQKDGQLSPTGCVYAARCPYAISICSKQCPQYTLMPERQRAACHRLEELKDQLWRPEPSTGKIL